MECELKFTVIRRRHHCRACGRLLCSACCSERMCLEYMEFREGRVCTRCKRTIDRGATGRGRGLSGGPQHGGVCGMEGAWGREERVDVKGIISRNMFIMEMKIVNLQGTCMPFRHLHGAFNRVRRFVAR